MQPAELRVLVVEDNAFQRAFLVRLLKKLGVQTILEAEHGRAALEVLGWQTIDVILCDLDMPEMDGLEFMRHLAQSERDCSVILNSALDASLIGSFGAMVRELGLKVLGALEKPISAARLQEMLELRGRQQGAPTGGYAEMSGEEVQRGLEAGELTVYYQPQVSLSSGSLVGCEALMRWQHPLKGLLLPGAFLGPLERQGLMPQATLALFEESLAQLNRWQEQGLGLTLSINLAPSFLAGPEASAQLLGTFAPTGLEPRLVTFDVTEEAVVEPAGQLHAAMARLRMKGFGLALDDYAARTSILQLSRFPFTELKVDPALLLNSHEESTRLVLESSLELGRKLKLKTVAEGVERSQDFDLLADLGCDRAQGSFIGPPMTAEDFFAWACKQPRRREPSGPVAVPAEAALRVGGFLAHYKLERLLGGGGMGKVYGGTDTRLLRPVAIKVLSGDSFSQTELERFLQEARAVARVQHPGIVTIYEIGREPVHYIAMECIEGQELEEMLGAPLPLTQALDLTIQILEALQAVHAKGVVHRDLKPSNIMVDRLGRVRIMDFGLATFLGEVSNLTNDGLVMGTPRYMSPEHLDRTLGAVDERSDLFAVGTILYQMLTGSPTTGGDSISQLITEVLQKLPPHPRESNPGIPEELSLACMKALQKRKQDRYAGAEEFLGELKSLDLQT